MSKFDNIYKNNSDSISEMIRVNHAGEFGAKRIYEGQIKHTEDLEQRKLIEHMKNQELQHLEYFETQIPNRKIRPTILMPIWSILGYGLGAITAKLGPKSAMACTDAVEEVISNHYQEQIDELKENAPEQNLCDKIIQFRQEELEHQHIAIENESRTSIFNALLSKAIRSACKGAIEISRKF